MENVTKALLIAGGTFLVVLILSILVVTYNNVSTYYAQKHDDTMIEQAQEFNAKFENYHRNNIRGSDLISLMNRVIDYNSSQAYQTDKSYKRIRVNITLGTDNILKQFKYETDDTTTKRNEYLKEKITNVKGIGNGSIEDKNLIAITNTPTDLSEKAQTIGINNLTDTKLQQLSSNIANIIVDEDDVKDSMSAYRRFKRAELLSNILGLKVGYTADCDIRIDKTTGKTVVGGNIISDIKNIASQYYQYMQFKRAYFDCTEVKYDEDTNRVVEMNFKLQVKNEKVVFN